MQSEFGLCADSQVQKYGLGIKELWQVPDAVFEAGPRPAHPAAGRSRTIRAAGSWMYHFGDNYVSIGFVTHLNYKNPFLSPFDEFQRFKTHPAVRKYLEGGKRIAYGAPRHQRGRLPERAQARLPPGGCQLGDSAGFLNLPRIKGSHNAVKSGIMAADVAFHALQEGRSGDVLPLDEAYAKSGIRKELHGVRNVKPSVEPLRHAPGLPRSAASTCGPPPCWAASASSAR